MATTNDVIGTVFSCDGNLLKDGDSPDTVSAWDSMTHIILISALEERFGITFSDTEMSEIATIGGFRRAVTEKHVRE